MAGGPLGSTLVQPGKFTIGALVSNLWSFAGQSNRSDVNTMGLQYFLNYNVQKGWFLIGRRFGRTCFGSPAGKRFSLCLLQRSRSGFAAFTDTAAASAVGVPLR
jgi:hypothetical protein